MKQVHDSENFLMQVQLALV